MGVLKSAGSIVEDRHNSNSPGLTTHALGFLQLCSAFVERPRLHFVNGVSRYVLRVSCACKARIHDLFFGVSVSPEARFFCDGAGMSSMGYLLTSLQPSSLLQQERRVFHISQKVAQLVQQQR